MASSCPSGVLARFRDCASMRAQSRVGLDPLGPQVTLGELVGQILRLDRHLARHVQGDRVRPVLIADCRQPSGHHIDGRVHAGRRCLGAALRTHQGRRQAAAGAQHVRGRGTRGAQSASVSWVVRSAGRLLHHAIDHVQVHAATHAAVTAHRGHRLHAPSCPRRSAPCWRHLISALLDGGYVRINSTCHRAYVRREVVKVAAHCRYIAHTW
jgi:hypothetical protein